MNFINPSKILVSFLAFSTSVCTFGVGIRCINTSTEGGVNITTSFEVVHSTPNRYEFREIVGDPEGFVFLMKVNARNLRSISTTTWTNGEKIISTKRRNRDSMRLLIQDVMTFERIEIECDLFELFP